MLRSETIVIGGSGFVGAFLVKRLARTRRVRVISDARVPASARVPEVLYTVVDMTKGSASFDRLLRKADVLVVMTQPDERIRKTLAMAIAQAPQLQRVVYTSSVLVYPSASRAQDERSRVRPHSPYEEGKWNDEQELRRVCASVRVPLCIARLGNVYGGDRNRGIIRILFRAAVEGSSVTLNGGGAQERDYVFVEDIARALAFLAQGQQTESIRVVNVSTGRPTSIRKLRSSIARIVGRPIAHTDGPAVRGDKARVTASVVRLRTLMPKFAPVPIEVGLRRTYRNIRKGI
jgi:UDP-glucose 4-epimerase